MLGIMSWTSTALDLGVRACNQPPRFGPGKRGSRVRKGTFSGVPAWYHGERPHIVLGAREWTVSLHEQKIEIHYQDQLAPVRTRDRHLKRPPQRPEERRAISPGSILDSAQDLFPRNSDRALSIKVVKPPIEFFALRIGQGYCLGAFHETLPELFQQPQLLLMAQLFNVHGGAAHALSVSDMVS